MFHDLWEVGLHQGRVRGEVHGEGLGQVSFTLGCQTVSAQFPWLNWIVRENDLMCVRKIKLTL